MGTPGWVVLGVFVTIGTCLMTNLGGVSRGLADIFRPLREESPWFYATTPTRTWQWRLMGVAFVVGPILIALDPPS